MKTQLKTQWQCYKVLELIPDSVSEPKNNEFLFALPLRDLWRSLIDTLTRELVYEQQIEYLERCWNLDCLKSDSARNNDWHRLWTLMN